MTGPSQLSIAELNELPDLEAKRALGGCCTAQRWIDEIVNGRGYASVDELLVRSDAAVAELTPQQLDEALAGHPRIGDRRAASGPGWSAQEQAGVFGGGRAAPHTAAADGAAAGGELAAALAGGNAEYERRFGHIYLVCATGKSGQELLAILRERLGNDRDTEWKVVAAELAKINQLRLRKLLGAQA